MINFHVPNLSRGYKQETARVPMWCCIGPNALGAIVSADSACAGQYAQCT